MSSRQPAACTCRLNLPPRDQRHLQAIPNTVAILRLASQGAALLLAAIAAAVLPSCNAAASRYSDLWGKNGELWDPTKLPDFSYAGKEACLQVAGLQEEGPGREWSRRLFLSAAWPLHSCLITSSAPCSVSSLAQLPPPAFLARLQVTSRAASRCRSRQLHVM